MLTQEHTPIAFDGICDRLSRRTFLHRWDATMPLTFKPRHGSVQIVAGWLAIVVAITGAADPPRKKLSPSERLTSPRLKAATEDAQRLQHLRRRGTADCWTDGLSRDSPRSRRRLGTHRRYARRDACRSEEGRRQIILLTDHHRPPEGFHRRQLARRPRRRALSARLGGRGFLHLSHAVDHGSHERADAPVHRGGRGPMAG